MHITQKLFDKIYKISINSLDLPRSEKAHFTFICERNKIISFGWNNGWKTHPMGKKYKMRYCAIHSELHAIQNFPYPPKYLQKFKLINIRILPRSNNIVGLARPCKHCQNLLFDLGISDVWYSTNHSTIVPMDWNLTKVH